MKSILTPRQVADAIGVSESSVKRWVDLGHIAATRTAGGHRRIAGSEAVRYIREHALAVQRPDLLGLPSAPTEAAVGEDEDRGERLFRYLRSGDAAEAHSLILSSYLEGSSVAQLVDGPLTHAMERIGELWVSNPSGIFWEHRATQIAFESLSRLRRLIQPADDAPVAVGGAPTGDRYMLASLAVAAVLEDEGFQVRNLGPETPISALALAVEELDARLAWLSVSVAVEVEKLRRDIGFWLPKLEARGAVLVIGGAKASRLGLARTDAVYVGRSMSELEALVRGMRLASRGATGASD